MISLVLSSGLSRRVCHIAAAALSILALALVGHDMLLPPAAADEPAAAPPLAEPFALEDPARILPSPVPRIHLADFSPDGKLLATTAGWHGASTPVGAGGPVENGELVLWDVAKREPRSLVLENNTIRAAAFSPDGKLLAYCMYSGHVKLVDVAAGKMVKVFGRHKALANAVCFSPDGKTVVSCGFDQTLRLWDVAEGKQVKELRPDCRRIAYVTFSPDGKKLATGDWERPYNAQIWDVKEGTVLHSLPHASIVETLAFSPDSTKLATTSWSNHVVVWDVEKGEELMRKEERGGIGLMFSPDGKLLAACGRSSITAWNMPGGEERWTTPIPAEVWSVRFSPDSKTLAAACRQNAARLYEAATGEETAALTRNADPADEPTVVRAVAFSADGKLLATAGDDRQVQLRDATSGFIRETIKGFKEPVTSLAFSPAGSLLATASNDRIVKLWDVKDPAKPMEKLTLSAAKEQVAAVSFSPDGKTLAIGGYDKTVRLYSVADGEERAVLEGHDAAVRAIAFSPDGRRLASGSGDHTIRLWDLEKRSTIITLEGHTAAVRSVAFAPDGRLVSGGEDGKLRFWDADGAARGSADAHREMVWAVAFVGKSVVVSGGADGQLLVWDHESRESRQHLAAHPEGVTSLAVSPDGRRVASGGADRTVKIWKAKEREW